MVKKHRVTYEVEQIQGTCPVYKVGDKVVIDSQPPTEVINLKESTAVCRRILDNMTFPLELQHGSDDLADYQTAGVGESRIACPMPGDPWTSCGYVIFRQYREDLE